MQLIALLNATAVSDGKIIMHIDTVRVLDTLIRR
jgi:hypothetical protein